MLKQAFQDGYPSSLPKEPLMVITRAIGLADVDVIPFVHACDSQGIKNGNDVLETVQAMPGKGMSLGISDVWSQN